MKKPEKVHGIAGAAGIGLSMVFSLLVIYLLIGHGYAAGIFKHRQHRDGVPVHG